MLPGARKDPQIVTSEWQKTQPQIEGVTIREVLHVPRDHGVITETFRPEWDPTGKPIVHVYQSRLFPAAIGAWSCHLQTRDRRHPDRRLAWTAESRLVGCARAELPDARVRLRGSRSLPAPVQFPEIPYWGVMESARLRADAK